MIDPSFWQGRRVLVSGHTGFKGAWTCLWLQRLGAQVTGFALPPPTKPSLFEIADVATGMRSVEGDVRDLERVCRVVQDSGAEVILHMAAQSLVRPSYQDPVTTYATNVMGTVNVLEAARLQRTVGVVVNVTSDKCYENREWLWGYREGEPLGGADPYSSSKGCSEIVTSAYRQSFFSQPNAARTAVASARAGNVIGGGDWGADRLVPDFFRASAAGQHLVLRNPDAVRPWQHVLEPLSGYLMLVQSLWRAPADFAQAWNFGPPHEEEWPVRRIVERLVQLTPAPAKWRVESSGNPHEARSLKLDSSKARVLLGWRPRLSVDGALRMVVEWFSAYSSAGAMRALTEAQIENYERLLSG